jgi:hypothetical protein
MSRSRVVVLCISVGLSVLVANSVIAFAFGRDPAIFDGLVFHGLLAACATCWVIYGLEVRVEHVQRAERAERVQNFSTAIHYADGDKRTSSGSWHTTRPST